MILGNVLMNRQVLFEHSRRERKSGISPIIATLLLILIAIAAGVVVYAYVIGFVGNTTTGQGSGTSQIAIDTAAAKGSTGALTAFVRNVGGSSATISAFYVVDTTGNPVAGGSFIGTTSASSAVACATITTTAGMDCTLAAGNTVQINIASGITMSAGSSYQLKISTADGSFFTYSFKAN
jgi:archaeal type IV pilus assembly protein PilA